jgi:hypothetical protein
MVGLLLAGGFMTEQPAAPARAAWVVDDFEDGDLLATSRVGWVGLSDAAMGGGSSVELSTVKTGRSTALRISGSVEPSGFIAGWVGLAEGARAVELGGFDGVRLRVRGEGEWQVGIRDAQFANHMGAFEGSAEWRQVDVPFASLVARPRSNAGSSPPPAFRGGPARWIGVQSAPGQTGRRSIEVDEIALYSSRAAAGRVEPGPVSGFAMDVRRPLTPPDAVAKAKWQALASDATGDGTRPGLPDATSLSSSYDDANDIVWFRIETATPLRQAFGANLAFDLDGDPSNGTAWWGTNTAFKFDFLVTTYVYARDATTAQGTIGMADAASASQGRMMESATAPLLAVDGGGRAVYLGVPRSVLAGKPSVRLLAAVGSQMLHNDDIPDEGAVPVPVE